MSTSTGKQISRSASLAVRMVLVAVFTPTVALGLLAAVIVLLPSRYLVGLAVALLSDQSPTAVLSTLPRRKPRLCLTKALREQLTLQELEAVLGHELAHIANRDALVMSVVGMPGWIMLNVRGGGPDGLLVAVIGLVSQASTLILSRYRELAADAGAANLTGRPSALASASASRALSISSALGISRALSISRA